MATLQHCAHLNHVESAQPDKASQAAFRLINPFMLAPGVPQQKVVLPSTVCLHVAVWLANGL